MSTSRRIQWLAAVLGVIAIVACGPSSERTASADRPTATGAGPQRGTYVGTWEQMVPNGWSKITISEGSAGLEFDWSSETAEESVRCAEPGICKAYHGGQEFYEYRFRTFRRDDSPHLFMECRGTPLAAGDAPIRYVDRLELSADGQELWAHTIEADGFKARPPVKLTRISGPAP